MRRENSKFNTAFVSYEGGKLFNNDYCGFAELDGYACYVIADGLESGDMESHSAELAVQSAISSFHEHASIKPRALRRYLRAAHRALHNSGGHMSLRASVTVFVTDYKTARYAWAGNSRFYLYRAGRIFSESRDHSLSRKLADEGKLPLDKITLHEERGNLSRYAGQPGSLNPQISKKIKLKDGDAAVLLTRGLWEHCDAGDIRASLDAAENDPQKVVNGLETLLLDREPADSDNYTAAAVFIDKIFTDPNKGKTLKRVLAIGIPIFVLAAALSVVLFLRHRKNETMRRNMRTAFLSAIEYIEDGNYIRAGEEITSAVSLAKDLNDQTFRERAENYRKLTEAVTGGDNLFASGAYEDAQASYLAARDRSRFTDNAGKEYIDRKLAAVGSFISVRDLISLGDVLSASGDYAGAEAKYMAARQLASGINDADGRKQAIETLENLYSQEDRDRTQEQEAAGQREQIMKDAADMEASGDEAASMGDYTAARLRYIIARERFAAIDDADAQRRIDVKLAAVEENRAQKDEQAHTAARYTEEGDVFYDDGNYVDAKVRYILARNIYSRVGDDAALADILSKIEICDSRINDAPPSGAPDASGDSNVGGTDAGQDDGAPASSETGRSGGADETPPVSPDGAEYGEFNTTGGQPSTGENPAASDSNTSTPGEEGGAVG
ncbi:MAG: hypothetical protein LBD49_01025 [Oscillospiraceae bacterium]|jgi:serine/threonine protein phosphatase PrpC|nr:hypothetical protein [Oscillospiraceae bacterium]